jgi:hypothetical protein
MAIFYSMSKAQILAQLNAGNLVAGNLMFATDTQELFICATTTNSGVGIAPTNMILTGAITLGFSGDASSLGGAPIVGTPTVGQTLFFNGTSWEPQTAATTTPNIVSVTGNYSTQITDDVLIVSPASP